MTLKADITENLGNSIIQHGPANDRVYLMKYGGDDTGILLNEINALAAENNYTKLFAKVSADSVSPFLEDGFVTEAKAPGLCNNNQDCMFVSKFIDRGRMVDRLENGHKGVLELAIKASKRGIIKNLSDDYFIRKCGEDDAGLMSGIYSRVYDSYPFPIDDPEFLKETMRDRTHYIAVEFRQKIVALASMEVDEDWRCVEMTDFATIEEHRGQGLASHLLVKLEADAVSIGMRSSYTIARAISPGMNIAFAKAGYEYGGRLVNNTQISGSIESMNVWSKKLQ